MWQWSKRLQNKSGKSVQSGVRTAHAWLCPLHRATSSIIFCCTVVLYQKKKAASKFQFRWVADPSLIPKDVPCMQRMPNWSDPKFKPTGHVQCVTNPSWRSLRFPTLPRVVHISKPALKPLLIVIRKKRLNWNSLTTYSRDGIQQNLYEISTT